MRTQAPQRIITIACPLKAWSISETSFLVFVSDNSMALSHTFDKLSGHNAAASAHLESPPSPRSTASITLRSKRVCKPLSRSMTKVSVRFYLKLRAPTCPTIIAVLAHIENFSIAGGGYSQRETRRPTMLNKFLINQPPDSSCRGNQARFLLAQKALVGGNDKN